MVKTKVKDGWHKIYNYEVYTENGKVVKAIINHRNGDMTTGYLYGRSYPSGLERRSFGQDFNTVKQGIYKGTWFIR